MFCKNTNKKKELNFENTFQQPARTIFIKSTPQIKMPSVSFSFI